MNTDETGIVLAVRPHDENHAILSLLTPSYGRVSAFVHGGQSRAMRPVLMAGNLLQLRASRTRADAMPSVSVELDMPFGSAALAAQVTTLGVASVTSLLHFVLPENEPQPQVFAATQSLLSHLDQPEIWPVILVHWELGLLAALGFGLSLDACAATGRRQEDGATLAYVSPRTGCAVSLEAGAPYKDRLLPLPGFLIGDGPPDIRALAAAFALTGHFLASRLCTPLGAELPEARARLISRLGRGSVFQVDPQQD